MNKWKITTVIHEPDTDIYCINNNKSARDFSANTCFDGGIFHAFEDFGGRSFIPRLRFEKNNLS